MSIQVLVCGGRDFADSQKVNDALDKIHAERVIESLIEGGAGNSWYSRMLKRRVTIGADLLAKLWAQSKGIQVFEHKANWDLHGKAAGPIRNQQMIDRGNPVLVVAFPGNHGTADMVRRARKAGIEVIEIE